MSDFSSSLTVADAYNRELFLSLVFADENATKSQEFADNYQNVEIVRFVRIFVKLKQLKGNRGDLESLIKKLLM